MTQSLDALRTALIEKLRMKIAEYDSIVFNPKDAQDILTLLEAASLSDQSAGDGWKPRPIKPDDKSILVKLKSQCLNKEVDDEFLVLTKWSNNNWHSSAGNVYIIGEDFENLVWPLPPASPIPVDRRAVLEEAAKCAENWGPVEKLLPLCDAEANEAAMTGQWEARERIVEAIRSLAASPSLANEKDTDPASKGPMEADIERVAKALVKQGLFYGNGECLFEVDDAMDLARAALGAMQHE